jgi:hypothetical protein
MPYIIPESRKHIDPFIDPLCKCGWDTAGDLNYIITRIALSRTPCRYSEMNEIIGALECAKQEIYRRCVADLENWARDKHGDLAEFAEVQEVVRKRYAT